GPIRKNLQPLWGGLLLHPWQRDLPQDRRLCPSRLWLEPRRQRATALHWRERCTGPLGEPVLIAASCALQLRQPHTDCLWHAAHLRNGAYRQPVRENGT